MTDQAQGLRRLLATPGTPLVAVLGASPEVDRTAVLANLAATLARAGRDTVIVDARRDGAGGGREAPSGEPLATLADVARQRASLDDAIARGPDGYGFARLARRESGGGPGARADARRLERIIAVLAATVDVVVVDADLDADGRLPLASLDGAALLLVAAAGRRAAIDAYRQLKRLRAIRTDREVSLLIDGVGDEADARRVYANMAGTARRFLALPLALAAIVPDDAATRRAAALGRPVVEAFPLSTAAAAYRRLAETLVGAGAPPGATSGDARHFVTTPAPHPVHPS